MFHLLLFFMNNFLGHQPRRYVFNVGFVCSADRHACVYLHHAKAGTTASKRKKGRIQQRRGYFRRQRTAKCRSWRAKCIPFCFAFNSRIFNQLTGTTVKMYIFFELQISQHAERECRMERLQHIVKGSRKSLTKWPFLPFWCLLFDGESMSDKPTDALW